MRFNKHFALLLAAASLFSSSKASADIGQIIPMGDLERWAAFSIGAGGSEDRFSDFAYVDGDFAAAEEGMIRVLGNAVIDGDMYYTSHRRLRAPQAAITGACFRRQDLLLRDSENAARAAARAAAAFAANRAFDSIGLSQNQNLTLTGAPGENVVLNLGNFQMSGDSILTLQGGANTTFIINVTNQFSLADNARIVLAGGVDWSNVLFNVRGRGSAVRFTGNARLEGILLATGRTVSISDQSVINGQVIANQLLVLNAGRITHPSIVSP